VNLEDEARPLSSPLTLLKEEPALLLLVLFAFICLPEGLADIDEILAEQPDTYPFFLASSVRPVYSISLQCYSRDVPLYAMGRAPVNPVIGNSLKVVRTHLSVSPVPVQASYASRGGFLAGVEILALGFAGPCLLLAEGSILLTIFARSAGHCHAV
jgi:hypothetical protein